ncbi:LicD family protein [Roseburia faecis]|uniref:LicD family protein n=1 Tax=Roseburia faecis TaxID=301302 RepID=UPI003F9AEA8B
MRKINDKEVKEIELNMLKQFDVFCKKNDLGYFLCGGTLLGAIRHKGFIPWDDDIDIAMHRNDYDRMIKLIKEKGIGDNIVLKCLECNNSEYPFAKLVNEKTQINEKYLKSKNNTNIWIDIFPIDIVPDSNVDLHKISKKVEVYKRLLGVSHANPLAGKTKGRMIVKLLIYPFIKIYGSERLAEKIQEIANKYSVNESNYRMVLVWGYGIKEKLRKEVFDSSVEKEFEGQPFPVPVGWDEYLKALYGDYMTLPPIEERRTHDFVAWIDE